MFSTASWIYSYIYEIFGGRRGWWVVGLCSSDRTQLRLYIIIHTYIHTYKHTYIHTYIYIHIYIQYIHIHSLHTYTTLTELICRIKITW